MRDLGRVVGHIPARGGSKRVPAKNLRYLCGKPMIAYAIACALRSEVLDDVYLSALSRFPSADEKQRLAAFLASKKSARAQAVQDLAWALLNAKEFEFNH